MLKHSLVVLVPAGAVLAGWLCGYLLDPPAPPVPAGPPPSQAPASLGTSFTSSTAGASYYCTTQGGCIYQGGAVTMTSGMIADMLTEEDTYAVGALLPDEARRDPAARAAVRAWASQLPPGRARSAYLKILDAYDQAESEQRAVRGREAAAQELARAAPRAACRRGPDGYTCETAP